VTLPRAVAGVPCDTCGTAVGVKRGDGQESDEYGRKTTTYKKGIDTSATGNFITKSNAVSGSGSGNIISTLGEVAVAATRPTVKIATAFRAR
jgi:hypothetical protein